MENRNSEKGYLLILVSFVAIVIAAMFLSITYYYTRIIKQNHFYAFGQELAQIANAAHYYAQWQQMNKNTWGVDYESDPTLTQDISFAILQADNFLPDTLVPFPIKAGTATVTIRGTLGPKNMLATARGATAYLFVDFNYPAGRAPSPSDMNALIAGASGEGLLVGVPKSPKLYGFASDMANSVSNANREDCVTDTGGTAKAWVTWGDGPYDCMSSADINTVFDGGTANSMQYYDLIIPTWTVAQSKQDIRAVYRLKQPGLPMAQTMQTDVDMASYDIGNGTGVDPVTGKDVLEIQTDFITTVDANVGGELYVADGAGTGSSMGGDVETINGGNLSHSDETGAVTLTAANADPDIANVPTLSVGGDMFVSAAGAIEGTIGTQNVLKIDDTLITNKGPTGGVADMTISGELTGKPQGVSANELVMNVTEAGYSQTVEIEEMNTGPGTSITISDKPSGGGGNMIAGNHNFDTDRMVAREMGSQNMLVEPASNDAASDLVISGDIVGAESMDVRSGSGYSGSITGIGSAGNDMTVNNQCYGACPDMEDPPPDDPFD